METFNQIQKIIAQLSPDFNTMDIEITASLGHILQQDVTADMHMPPFNKSAMDGYACRKEDITNELEVLEIIAAGSMPSKSIGKNQCSKIMTGAAVPDGADCVFMIEDAAILDSNRVKCNNLNSKQNICFLGEDYKNGDVLLKKGVVLQPEHLSVIAGAGLERIQVSEMPKISLIVTGSELVEFSIKPEEGKIRNTNAVQLISLLKKMHMEVSYQGIVSDNYDKLQAVFQRCAEENDILIITGGAAVGDFDLVPDVIHDEGFHISWTRTGLKPGNPMIFAMKDHTYVFGLSGNPVSSFVQFECLVKPVIFRLLGSENEAFRFQGMMASPYLRKNASRLGIVPVRINKEGTIEALPFNGSAHINALSFANALLEIPVGKKEIKEGEMVYVRPI